MCHILQTTDTIFQSMRNKEPNLAVATSVVLKLGSILLLLYNEETLGFSSEWCLVGRGKHSWQDKEIEQGCSDFHLSPQVLICLLFFSTF